MDFASVACSPMGTALGAMMPEFTCENCKITKPLEEKAKIGGREGHLFYIAGLISPGANMSSDSICLKCENQYYMYSVLQVIFMFILAGALILYWVGS